MRKMLSLLLAISMLGTMIVGCTKTETASDIVILNENFGSEEYGIGFRNTDIALGLEVQRQLDEMQKDGKYLEISKKWFGADTSLPNAKFIEEDKAPAGDKSLETIIAKKTLVVGLDDTFPPMGYRDDKNEIVGFDIDLAKEVGKRMGVEVKLQPIDWDAKELELSTNKIDCIWNGMSIDKDRIASMFFAKPYIANKQVILAPKNSKVTKISDLEGKKVGLQKGSTALGALKGNEISTKVAETNEYPSNIDVFNDLKAGRIDVMVADEVVSRYILENSK